MGIEQIPGLMTTGLTSQLSTKLTKMTTQLTAVSSVSNSIPEGAACDSPEIQHALNQIADLQKLIADLQKFNNTINTIIKTVQVLATTAAAIKAIQIANPITGPGAIVTDIMVTQTLLLANVLATVKGLVSLPNLIDATVSSAQAGIASAIEKVTDACPNAVVPVDQGTADYLNADLDSLEKTLKDAISDQEGLLVSIEEAPSKVYQGAGIPTLDLGKPADYYIDSQSKRIYGPKPNRTSWGDGIKFE